MTFKSAVPCRRDFTLKNRVPGSCCKNTFATVFGLGRDVIALERLDGAGMRIVVGTAPIGTSYGLESSRMAFRMTPRGAAPRPAGRRSRLARRQWRGARPSPRFAVIEVPYPEGILAVDDRAFVPEKIEDQGEIEPVQLGCLVENAGPDQLSGDPRPVAPIRVGGDLRRRDLRLSGGSRTRETPPPGISRTR